MKWTIILLSLWLPIPILLPAQSQLLRIEEGGKYGFINIDGDVVIPPIYANAINFSEGLAAVRLTDKFGFIDATGHWKIPPIYDYASSFKNGQAKVWLAGKEVLISPNAETLSKPDYRYRLPDGCNILETDEGKLGVINQNGAIILDSIYKQISWLPDGYFYLVKESIKDGAVLLENGIADRFGVLKIPFGQYTNLKPIGSGWFHVKKQDFSNYQKVGDQWVLSIKKRVKTSGLTHINDNIYRPITDPYFVVTKGKYNDGSVPATFMDTKYSRTMYSGFIDTTGQAFLADTNFNKTYAFSDGIAFISDRRDRKIYLIDKRGNRLNNTGITKLANPSKINAKGNPTGEYFINGWAFVKTDDGIAKINKQGNLQIIEELAGTYFGYFVEQRYLHIIQERDQPNPGRRSVYDVLEGKLLPIDFEMIYSKLYNNELFFTKENQQTAYVDTSGTKIWEQQDPMDIYPYDVDHKISLKLRKQRPKKIHWLYRIFRNKPKTSIGFRKKVFKENSKSYHANNLYLINYSKDTLVFDGSLSSYIPLKLQAKDSKGEWKNINYCRGCDVVAVGAKRYLPPGQYFYYRLPKFKGHKKTKFRIVVPYTKKGAPDVPLEMTTRFKGGINAAQFWRMGR